MVMMTKSSDREGKPAHTIADHGLGVYLDHTHAGDADHDHDYFESEQSPDEDSPLWKQDHVSLHIGESILNNDIGRELNTGVYGPRISFLQLEGLGFEQMADQPETR